MTADPVRVSHWEGLDGLDRLLEHRSRLGIAVLLGRSTRMTFRHLKDLLGETDGNLGAHLKKMAGAEYLKANKTFIDGKPVTWYSLTRVGQVALRKHLDAMERIIENAAANDFGFFPKQKKDAHD